MAAAPLAADLILRSGRILTMDARGREVEALAALHGRLVAVGADRPVKASRIDGHPGVVNSLGLQRLRLPAGMPGIERDARGRPTGVLKEAAYEATLDRIVDPPALYRKALPRMERRAHKLG